MKNIVLCDSFGSALDSLAKEIRGKSFSPDRKYIVLTPDRYTLKVEQALFSGRGSLNCEVLTLSRLCRRVLDDYDALSREGAVILMRRAIDTVEKGLTYYKHAAHFTDFARQVYETVEQAASSGADLAAIAGEAQDGKMHDLALIKSEYDRLKTEEGCLDSSDRLKALMDAVKVSERIASADFYAIGYSDATKLNYAVFDEIAKVCRFTLYDVEIKPEETLKNLEVYGAPDAISQYKLIASRIRNHVIEGGAYGDISVICSNTNAISRIFREYGIDFYADNSAPLYVMPALKAIELAYKLHSGDCSTSVVTALCANVYSGCNSLDAEMLAFELRSRGAKFCPETRVLEDERSRRARARAYKLASYFDGKSFTDAVESMITGEDFEGQSDKLKDAVRQLSSDDDLVFTDTVNPIRNILDLIKQYGSTSFDDDAACFFSAAQCVEIRSVPRFSDRVTIGADKTFRMNRCEKLFVADFNEGVLPTSTVDSGLLSDDDIRNSGNIIEPTVRELNSRSRRELYEVMRNAKSVVCTYHTAAGAKPSSFLAGMFDLKKAKNYADEIDMLKTSTSAPFVARLCCSRASAGEAAERGDTLYSAELRIAAGESKSSPPFENTVKGIEHDRLSVSEMSNWFKCPYKRFLTDSVGIKERRKKAFSTPDYGTVMHAFMEKFVDADYDCSQEFAEKTIDGILSDSKLELDKHERDNLIRNAIDYAVTNKRIIDAGTYRPNKDYTERGFGGEILLGKKGIPFVGRIDRVDMCEDSERVRIIDYKTSDKQFDMDKCIDGRDMQLAMYAASVGKDKYVTGAFYVPLKNYFSDGKGKLRGFIVKDKSVMEDYDGEFFEKGKSDVLPYSMYPGNKTFYRNGTLLEREAFGNLIDRCVATADNAADEIDSGYIERTPADGECEFCTYKALCADKKAR